MAEKICEMKIIVERREGGSNATGDIAFHGTELDKAHVLAHIFEALELETGSDAVFLLLAAHAEYAQNHRLREEKCEGVDFVEEAKEWQ